MSPFERLRNTPVYCLSLSGRATARAVGAFGARCRRLDWLVAVLGTCLVLLGCSPGPAKRREPSSQAPPPVAVEPLTVDADALIGSVHEKLDCSGCHGSAEGEPPTSRERFAGDRSRCTPCHRAADQSYESSVHAEALRRGVANAARCSNCHGAHDILASKDPRSRTNKRQIPITCSRCHHGPRAAPLPALAEQPVTQYAERIHQRALVSEGLLVAPACTDCHGKAHQLRAVSDPKSPVARPNVPHTCGRCHAGIEAEYRESVHGRLLAEGKSDAPICTDCHVVHDPEGRSGSAGFDSRKVCGRCHQKQVERYLRTYHGRALELGHGTVADCHDCHGSHRILKASDPRSTLSPAHRAATCRHCHKNATDRFASFQAHGDYTDRQGYPILFWTFVVMSGLILGTFVVWGIHTVLWMVRMFIELFREPRRVREEKRHAQEEHEGKVYTRFGPIDRLCHTLIIISFLTLVATGMPLKFHDTAWAKAFFDVVGGPEVAAVLHRIGAFISGIYLLIHVVRLTVALIRDRAAYRDERGKFRLRRLLGVLFGPDSPLPNLDDLKDVKAQVRYFLGKGSRPTFDRFTYWEKFDYIAEFWGSAFIGLSGLVMWFPGIVTRVAPGWVINVAHVIHSQEALLAAGFILTVHFFNGHLRTEKFPMDTVMFSGRITEQELIHERGRQYRRLKESGKLQAVKAGDDWKTARYIYDALGLIIVYLGLTLAAAILWAVLRRWGGG